MSVIERLEQIFASRALNELNLGDIPPPDSMKNISVASKILKNAILNNRKIAIIGDYDVDGVSASAIIFHFFKEIKFDNFVFKIPNRFRDGYGIKEKFIDELGADVYLSVDNGIVAFDVAETCAKKGKILIITDHHKPLIVDSREALPNALVINPWQKDCEFLYKEICGAMVAWYLCAGIKKAMGLNLNLAKLCPFVALAIISDVMPLKALNRAIYKKGIREMRDSKIPAFIVLREKYKITSENIGFYITPILNSAGRMEDASLALDFFLSENLEVASERFRALEAINAERKKIQNDIFKLAKAQHLSGENVVLAFGESWHEGVLGIVAAKMCEEYQKNAFCFSLNNDVLGGSGRANGANLIATLQKINERDSLFLNFGGHAGAVGLSLKRDNLDIFMKSFEELLCVEHAVKEESEVEILIDEIDLKIVDFLDKFEPFGNGNPAISFVIKRAKCVSSNIFGKSQAHQNLMLRDLGGKNLVRGVLFNDTSDLNGRELEIVCSVKKDEYRKVAEITISQYKILA